MQCQWDSLSRESARSGEQPREARAVPACGLFAWLALVARVPLLAGVVVWLVTGWGGRVVVPDRDRRATRDRRSLPRGRFELELLVVDRAGNRTRLRRSLVVR
jgi:hypothetical protein